MSQPEDQIPTCPDIIRRFENEVDKSNILTKDSWVKILKKVHLEQRILLFHVVGALHNAECEFLHQSNVRLISYEHRKIYIDNLNPCFQTVKILDYDFSFPDQFDEDPFFFFITADGKSKMKLLNWTYQLSKAQITSNIYFDDSILGEEDEENNLRGFSCKVTNIHLYYEPEQKRKLFCINLRRFLFLSTNFIKF